MMMKRTGKKLVRPILLLTTVLFFWGLPGQQIFSKGRSPKKECHAYVVMDAGSGKVLYGQNRNKKIYPASTAKLMTAVVCIEQGNVDSRIKTQYDIVNGTTPGAYCVGLPSGVTFSFRDLLNLSLIASAADATDSLAVSVFGSKKACAEAMTEKCRELGLKHTSFDNPVGNDIGAGFTKTYATAKEMALITRYAMTIPMIRKIVAKSSYQTRYGADIQVNSTNLFLRGTIPYDTGTYKIIGSKSGTTNAAGHVFIATAMDKKGHEVICAFFGNGSKEDTFRSIRSLLDYTFKQYKKGKIKLTNSAYDIRCDKEAGEIYTKNSDKGCFPVGKTGRFRPGKAVTRKQLARMLSAIDGLKGNRKLAAFVAANKKGTLTSLDLALLVNRLYPDYTPSSEKDPDSEEEELVAKAEAAGSLSEEERDAFIRYLRAGLAPDKSCRNPAKQISRKEALLFADRLIAYPTAYDIRHPSGSAGEVDENGSIKFHVTEPDEKTMDFMKEQIKTDKKQPIE